MIIFELDDVLADTRYRRNLIDPSDGVVGVYLFLTVIKKSKFMKWKNE